MNFISVPMQTCIEDWFIFKFCITSFTKEVAVQRDEEEWAVTQM